MSEPSVETQNKIINLIKEILSHYEELDNHSSNQIKYYCHTEFDSNVTEFEGLSNCNKIVLKSKLNTIHIPGIMKIFQAIYDNNYYMFEDRDFALEIYDNNDLVFNDQHMNDLMSYENVDMWLELFDMFNNDCETSDDFIHNEKIYDDVPMPSNNYRIQKRQKIYTIASIKQLLDE